ncbi:hypothetical protein Droror1_Dr00002404 [Drosera rotundifolia]
MQLLALEESWSFVDPLANSFVAPVTDDIKDDKQLTFEEYERTWEQNEELGLNDMDTSSAMRRYNESDFTYYNKEDTSTLNDGFFE